MDFSHTLNYVRRSLYIPTLVPVSCARDHHGDDFCWQAPGSGEVIMCEHGDRRVTRMENNGTKTPLATHFNVREA